MLLLLDILKIKAFRKLMKFLFLSINLFFI